LKTKRVSKISSPHKEAAVAADRQQGTYQKTLLSNGVRVISEQIPFVRSVSVGVWVNNGSRDETESTNGISHFIEHMVFKGTKKRSVREIARSLESVGGYLNAFTGKEHTCYYARVLDQHTPLAIDVLSDMVLDATFPAPELEKEKGVVIDELKQAEDDPDDIIHDYFERAIFGQHTLGNPIIGTEKNLRSFSQVDLFKFRAEKYLPNSVVLTAAGNIEHTHLVALAEKAFRTFGSTPGNGRTNRAHPKRQKGGLQEFQKPIQQAHICTGTTSYSIQGKERYPLMTLNAILGEGMSSRLFQNIREKHGFAYSVYSYANLLSDSGSFGVYVGTDRQHVEKCVELIWKELKALRSTGVSVAELRRVKEQMKGSMMLGLESIPNRMMRLGTSELYFGELTPIDSITKKVEAVRAEDVQAIADDLFREDRFATIIFKPESSKN
jgi:predicted Zn-dependent peptidase